jgi:hypothetical protein
MWLMYRTHLKSNIFSEMLFFYYEHNCCMKIPFLLGIFHKYRIYASARKRSFPIFGAKIHDVTLNSRMKRRTRPRQTGSLWTGPCRDKPRPASPNHKKSALKWDITWHTAVIPCRRFSTTYWYQLRGSRYPKESTEHNGSQSTNSSVFWDFIQRLI